MNALCPARGRGPCKCRAEYGDFLVLRLLFGIRSVQGFNWIFILVVAVVEAACQASGALGGKVGLAGPLAQHTRGHIDSRERGRGSGLVGSREGKQWINRIAIDKMEGGRCDGLIMWKEKSRELHYGVQKKVVKGSTVDPKVETRCKDATASSASRILIEDGESKVTGVACLLCPGTCQGARVMLAIPHREYLVPTIVVVCRGGPWRPPTGDKGTLSPT